MNNRLMIRVVVAALLIVPTQAWAQAENRPAREFPEFRGSWMLDQNAGKGHVALPLARTLLIETTSTEISLVKDSEPAEVYRLDGSETSVRRGVLGSLTLVADAVALTTRNFRCCSRGYAFTNVITDAYSVSGDTLTLERQLSVVVQPAETKEGLREMGLIGAIVHGPGRLATFEEPANSRQTIVYRRKP